MAEKKEDEKAKKPAKRKAGHYVCVGKSLTTKKGLVDAGGAVTAAHFAAGAKALEAFIESGHIEIQK